MKEEQMDSRLDKAFERLGEVPPPDAGRQAAQRQVFVSQIHRVQRATMPKPAVSKQTRRSFWPVGLGSRRMALAGALVALLLAMVTGTGVIYAADAAVPGDALYGIDQSVESLRLSLTTRPEATARLLVSLAQERLAEAEELSNRGDSENMAVALDGFGTAVASLAQAPTDTAEEDANAVAALLDEEFASQDELPVLPVPDVDVQDPDDGDDDVGEEDVDFCASGTTHPVAARLAEQYGVEPSVVMGWFCEGHYGMGEIMLALQTAEKSPSEEGLDLQARSGELLAMKTDLGGWGKVWQDLGLIGNGRKVATAPTEDEDQPDEEDLPDEEPLPGEEEVYCVGADPHPVGQALADTYDVGYDVVMTWFCEDHYGMGEIKHALQVSGTQVMSGTEMVTLKAQDLLDLRAEMGWGQVWHSLGMNGKPKKLTDEPTDETSVEALGEVHGNSSKVKEAKGPKVKPDAATKPKPAKPVKPAKAVKPVKPAKAVKPTKAPKPPKN